MRVATDIGGTFTDLIYLDEVTGETVKVVEIFGNDTNKLVEVEGQ